MQKQKVFFFVPKTEGGGDMIGADELRQMAMNYVNLYGEACLNDPETPSFVRHMMGKRQDAELQRAG